MQSEKPQRIQLSRKKGWRLPEGAVNVARPTKWGNPFRVATPASGNMGRQTRAGAVKAFRYRLIGLVAIGAIDLAPLRGKSLACWCPIGQPCHADVLMEFANREPVSDPIIDVAPAKFEESGDAGG